VTARVLPPSRRARARPFRPDCPGGAAARAMITETPQPISCFISTKSEILSGYAAPAPGATRQPAHGPHAPLKPTALHAKHAERWLDDGGVRGPSGCRSTRR
jgi:hypothetical protein